MDGRDAGPGRWTRRGDWIQTAHGRRFWPLDPRPEEVHVDDVAHSLSRQCRFAGHVLAPRARGCGTRGWIRARTWLRDLWRALLGRSDVYSVAEHLVRCSRLAEAEGASIVLQLAALLHDAPETYVIDVPRPLKRWLTGYEEIEAGVARVVERRFGLPVGVLDDPAVKRWDEILLATEARDVMGVHSAGSWSLKAEPLAECVVPWTPERARLEFLSRLAELTAEGPGRSSIQRVESPRWTDLAVVGVG